MDGELDCSKSGTSNWKNDVAQEAAKVLNRNFKNPYTSLPPVSHGGNITNDSDVGYHRLRSPGTTIKVWTCVKTPCSGTCLLYTSPSPRDLSTSRMPSSA